MRIWGYLLIFLNILAAGAFVYLATGLWQKRSEWQFALFKQELINRGLPVEPSEPPSDLDEDSVAFEYAFGPHKVSQIRKDRLKKLIPTGGSTLGDPAGPVTSQTDEVKRVEKVVFADIEAMKEADQRRLRQLILLLNLSAGSQHEGAYALLRDLPVPYRYERARREMAYLGRSAPQVSALTALADVAHVHMGFLYADRLPPAEIEARIRAGRKALAAWARSEVPYATPDAPKAAGAADEGAKNDNREALLSALNPLLTEAAAVKPDQAKIDAGKQRVKESVTGGVATTLLPYIADVGANPLSTPEQVAEAKAKLVELMHLRSTTDAEKKAVTALADLMIPPKIDLPADATLEQKQQALSKQFVDGIDAAANESIRAYFEEAVASTTDADQKVKLPADWAGARSQAANAKNLRDPEEKRRAIAHLLYHLDAHLGGDAAVRNYWYANFVRAPAPGENPYKLPPADETRLAERPQWHQRVAAIVGLETYAATAEAQATRLQQLAQALRVRMLEEQAVFESDYFLIVEETLYYAHQAGLREAEVKDQQALLSEHSRQLMTRQAEQKVLEDELTKVTAAAKKATDDLAVKNNELFQITKQLGEAQDALIGLELQLRKLELPDEPKKK